MEGRSTGIFDVVQAGGFGDLSGFRRADAELQPEAPGARCRRLARVLRAELRPAEHINHVDRLVDLADRGHAGDAEHLIAVGAHRDHPVALREQVAHDAVALP